MDSRVTVEHFVATYRIPRDHPTPDELKWRLDRVMERRLPESCREILKPLLDPADPSVWCIRRLDLSLTLDAGAARDDQVSRAWSNRLVEAVAGAIARGADGDEVLHFPDRASYLARFVIDLVGGRAWDRWYFRPFDSLRSLPLSAALGEALSREPANTLKAILHLFRTGRLEEIIRPLTGRDASKVYDACFADVETPGEVRVTREGIETLLQIWSHAPLQLESLNTSQNRLRLLATVANQSGTTIDTSLGASIDCLIGLADALRIANPTSPAGLDLRRGNSDAAITSIAPFVDPDSLTDLRRFQMMAQGDPEWAAHFVLTIDPSQVSTRAVEPASKHARTLVTPFAFLFLLLPSLLDLAVPEVTESGPTVPDSGVSWQKFLRFLIGLKLVGRNRIVAALNDPALEMFAGSDTPRFRDACNQLSNSSLAAMQDASLRNLIERLYHQGIYRGRYLGVEAVPTGEESSLLLLVRDLPRDAWLHVEYIRRDPYVVQDVLGRALETSTGIVGSEPEWLLIRHGHEQELITAAAAAALRPKIAWIDANGSSALTPLNLGQSYDGRRLSISAERSELVPDDFRSAASTWLGRASLAEGELEYFSVLGASPFVPITAEVDVSVTLLARAVLKAFALRLMGFEWSSPEHIYRNFLEGIGTIRVDSSTIRVELPRGPLALILRMAGVNGQTYSLPWLNDATVILSLGAD
jgi:hypothetical protein